MKKGFAIYVLAIIALMGGCFIPGSPRAAVQKFYRAVEKNDAKAMAEVATPETVQLMAMFGTKIQGMAAENGKVKALTETINGDTAVVTAVFENGEEMNIDLIKVDGKWKVSISMDK